MCAPSPDGSTSPSSDVYSRRIIGWQTSTSLYADLALDALKMAIWQRRRNDAFNNHSQNETSGSTHYAFECQK